MTKLEIYNAIVNWQMEAGESFLDYFDGDFNAVSYMMWCRGRNYITVEQFNLWEEAYINGEDEADEAQSLVYCDNEILPYAVVSAEQWTEEGQKFAFMILAEFISESVIYKNRLNKFLEEN